MKKVVILMLVVGFFSGCSSSHLGVKQDFKFQKGADTGLVVMSTRFIDNEECYPLLHPKHAMMLSYNSQNRETGTPITRLNVRNPIISKDFTDPDGFFHVQEAKAGKYVLSGIQYMGGSFMPVYLKGYTFEVLPNKVNYLGELTITETECREKGTSEAKLVFSDQSKRDEKLFRERVPFVSGQLIFQKVGDGSVLKFDQLNE